jgi:hypothetical protein
MPFDPVSLAISLGGSLLGGLFGDKKKQEQTTNSNSTTNSSSNASSQGQTDTSSTGYSRPIYDPLQGQLRDQLLQQYFGRLDNGGIDNQVNQQYLASLRALNQGRNLQKNNIAEQFASRGMNYSPAASLAQVQNDNQRFGNVVNLQSSLPAFRDQLVQQRLQGAAGYLSSLPVATMNQNVGSQNQSQNQQQNGTQVTNGTSTTTGTVSGGGGIGNGIASLGVTAAGLAGMGAFNGMFGQPQVATPNAGAFTNSNPLSGAFGSMNNPAAPYYGNMGNGGTTNFMNPFAFNFGNR